MSAATADYLMADRAVHAMRDALARVGDLLHSSDPTDDRLLVPAKAAAIGFAVVAFITAAPDPHADPDAQKLALIAECEHIWRLGAPAAERDS